MARCAWYCALGVEIDELLRSDVHFCSAEPQTDGPHVAGRAREQMALATEKVLDLLLDRTRRAWVAPARDGRYVLGQLRSRTAGVSFLSFWDGVCRHNWNGSKFEKSRLF